MKTKLISIVGIDSKMEQILREKAGIGSIKQLYDATRTASARAELAEKTNLSLANIAHWSAQAELLRVEDMDIHTAYDLIDAGIYSVDQLQSEDRKEIYEWVKKTNVHSSISEAKIFRLKRSAVRSAKRFEYDSLPQELVVTTSTAPSIYSDLSTIISELGKGIAAAQLALDRSSIETQNKILESDELYNMGLQATWYVMPEVDFTLKMDYTVTEKKSVSGKLLEANLGAAPSNATFNNMFKSSKHEESTLNLKFVPIPTSERTTMRRYMPDVYKVDSYGGLVAAMEDKGIANYTILPEEAADWEEDAIRVVSQKPNPGTLMKIGIVPEITIEKKK